MVGTATHVLADTISSTVIYTGESENLRLNLNISFNMLYSK